jgi:tight adherence protein B
MLVVSTIIVVFVATFLAAAVAVLAGWAVMQSREPAAAEGATPSGLLGFDRSTPLLKQDVLSTISVWARLLARFDFVQGMKSRIAEAGKAWSVGRVTLTMLLTGSVTLAVLWSLDWLPGTVGLGGACLAGSIPYVYILRLRASRLNKFEDQFPEALDYLSRALRAGHPFAASLEMLASESQPPLSLEMRTTFEERQLGMSWQQALDNLANRVPVMDVSFFAAAVLLQSRTGGKLGEVLGRLAETMRERSMVRGEIRALSTHGRVTGMVLTTIPIVVALVMSFVNPGYLGILLNHPSGKDLILAAAACLVTAHLVIRKIVNVKL